MSQREATLQLIAKRDKLEQELNELRNALESHGVAAGESLVTPDGFPRHDVDVHAVRNLRVQLIRKQNDMRALLEEISNSLQNAFPEKAKKDPADKSAASDANSLREKGGAQANSTALSSQSETLPRPLAVIKTVVSGTLGAEAGLESDDQVLKFGEAARITDFPAEMKRLSGRTLELSVRRGTEVKTFQIELVPGRSLGAHIVPV